MKIPNLVQELTLSRLTNSVYVGTMKYSATSSSGMGGGPGGR